MLVWLGGVFLGRISPLAAQGIEADHHPWARFAPGSWVQTRTVTETFNADQALLTHTVIRTRTELLAVDEGSYTVRRTNRMAILGKHLGPRTQILKRRLDDTPVSWLAQYHTHNPAVEKFRLGQEVFTCRVIHGTFQTPQGVLELKLLYCPEQSPFVLRRHEVLRNAQKQVLEETVWEVVALEMPFQVSRRILSTAHYRVLQRKPTGTITRVIIWSPEVPGGVVFETTKEQDIQGRLRRRSAMELVAYRTVSPAGQFGAVLPGPCPPRIRPKGRRHLLRRQSTQVLSLWTPSGRWGFAPEQHPRWALDPWPGQQQAWAIKWR